ALQQGWAQKSVRRKNEDARSQGELPPVPLAHHPLNDPATLFKSGCAAVRQDLGSIPVECRIETDPGGIIAAFMRAKHPRTASATRHALYCAVKAVWVE